MIRARSKYSLPKWKRARAVILERDHHSCAICQSGDFLSVHHRDRDPTNDDAENLVTLCDRCHALVHAMAVSPGFPKA
jgi:5-methylcytosine-specific restriction endonuclease McrA